MRLIRTVIVDDSAFVRKTVGEMLSRSPHIDVVGTARNGEDALKIVEQLQPDVITCDLTMPGLDGVGFVRAQMNRRALPIVILTASPEDAGKVIDALDAGAVDFIQKPTALANDGLLSMRESLIEKVKEAALAASAVRPSLPAPVPSRGFTPGSEKVDVVVLGISTGGPQALRYLLPQFPADFPVPLVIVLHMPIGYTAPFAEKLAEICRLPVKEAYDGCPVQRGEVLLAPAGRHLTFKKGKSGVVRVELSVEPMDKLHRPSADVLFKSAAEIYGERVLGVVMTGMGDDGKEGAAWIKAHGGKVLTQDEESCVIYGMPRSVAEAGLSDAQAPLALMAAEITKRL